MTGPPVSDKGAKKRTECPPVNESWWSPSGIRDFHKANFRLLELLELTDMARLSSDAIRLKIRGG